MDRTYTIVGSAVDVSPSDVRVVRYGHGFWSNKRRASVVSLMVVVIVGVAASPAYAFYAEAYHGSDESIGSGRVVTVEDNECDGHRVTAEYYTVLGNFGSFSDPDGCGGDSDFRNTWDGAQLSRIRVCEIGVGCSAWKP